MMGRKIIVIMVFCIVISIIPFPSLLSDFQYQKGILLLIFIFAVYPLPVYSNKILFSLLLFIYLLMTFSILFNMYRLDNIYDISSEILRYITLAIILNCVIYYTKGLNLNDIYIIKRFLILFIFIQLITNISRFTPFSFLYNELYGGAKSSIYRIRLSGTFENPNFLAFVISCKFALLLNLKNFFNKYHLCLLILTCILLIFLSGSRTGILFVLASALFYNIYFFIATITFSPFIFYILSLSKRFSFINTDLSFDVFLQQEAFRFRYDVILDAIYHLKQNFVFGYFQSPIQLTDNYFLMTFLRYGFIFPSLFFVYLLLILRKYKLKYILNKKIFLFYLIFIIFGLTGSFVDNFRLFLFLSLCFFISFYVNVNRRLICE